jgi:hypothetical protein
MSILYGMKSLAWLRGRAIPPEARDAYPLDERAARLFAADCAEHVLPIFDAEFSDALPREALRQVIGEIRRHADGETTKAHLTEQGEAVALAVMEGVAAALAREKERRPYGVPGRLQAGNMAAFYVATAVRTAARLGSPEAIATQTARHAVEAAANHAAASSEAWSGAWEWEGHAAAIEAEEKGGPSSLNAYGAALEAARSNALEVGRIAERAWQRTRFASYADRSASKESSGPPTAHGGPGE